MISQSAISLSFKCCLHILLVHYSYQFMCFSLLHSVFHFNSHYLSSPRPSPIHNQFSIWQCKIYQSLHLLALLVLRTLSLSFFPLCLLSPSLLPASSSGILFIIWRSISISIPPLSLFSSASTPFLFLFVIASSVLLYAFSSSSSTCLNNIVRGFSFSFSHWEARQASLSLVARASSSLPSMPEHKCINLFCSSISRRLPFSISIAIFSVSLIFLLRTWYWWDKHRKQCRPASIPFRCLFLSLLSNSSRFLFPQAVIFPPSPSFSHSPAHFDLQLFHLLLLQQQQQPKSSLQRISIFLPNLSSLFYLRVFHPLFLPAHSPYPLLSLLIHVPFGSLFLFYFTFLPYLLLYCKLSMLYYVIRHKLHDTYS